MDNYQLQIQINNAKKIYGDLVDQYGDQEAYASTVEIARKVYTIITWFEDNYADMTEAERYIMATKFIIPMLQNTFRSYSEMGEIDRNTGAPVMFGELVPHQVAKMGGQPVNMVTRNESIEDQINRIERLLKEKDDTYDLRIYNIQIGCTINDDIGGSESETATEIRGIPGVTTVRPVAASKRQVTPSTEYVLYDIKFELLGAASRVEYRDQVLLPALRKINGLKLLTVSSIHRTNKKGTIRTVRENLKEFMNFGGLASALGNQRSQGSGPLVTPRKQIQQVVDDWVEGGVMDYDRPMNNNLMQYHTMVPTEELLPFISRYYRGPKDSFDVNYQYFIKNGPEMPVYVAIGKNGRVKITGNEDLIWFAKKSGLAEIPVFFSYQMQV